MGSIFASSRRLTAELIAHLGEVEERRLHLAAACSSMFAYCLKLGMTEDEAYRRIEVARLARRYPMIFPLLANGQLSISVVALLKHHLSEENHLDLLTAVAGKSVGQARELLAARFPRPDVPSSVRKLPERRTMTQPSLVMSTPVEPSAGEMELSAGGMEPAEVAGTGDPMSSAANATSSRTRSTRTGRGITTSITLTARATASESADASETVPSSSTVPEKPARPTALPRTAPRLSSSRIEPLSAQRYKVQFTAGAELARKLELARDLMRHSHPDGELGPIVERALDLLIEGLMKRRFGQSKKAHRKRTSEHARHSNPEQRSDVTGDRSTMPATAAPDASTHGTAEPATITLDSAVSTHRAAEPATTTHDSAEPATTTHDSAEPATTTHDSAEPATTTHDSAEPATTTHDSADVEVEGRGELQRASTSAYIHRSTRRAVVERDGLGCSWIDEHGVRCGSQAWLEYDHRHPRAKGGSAEPDNVRLLCRSHNHLAAEQEYGRRHVEHAIAERRRHRAPTAI